jgi:hypothetical protein
MANSAADMLSNSPFRMTKEERFLYQHHLDNMNSKNGGAPVFHKSGEVSTLLQIGVGISNKTYNLPTVYGGRILPTKEAVQKAKDIGIDKFPSYNSDKEAEDRYQQMHKIMDADIGNFLNGRPNAR